MRHHGGPDGDAHERPGARASDAVSNCEDRSQKRAEEHLVVGLGVGVGVGLRVRGRVRVRVRVRVGGWG